MRHDLHAHLCLLVLRIFLLASRPAWMLPTKEVQVSLLWWILGVLGIRDQGLESQWAGLGRFLLG